MMSYAFSSLRLPSSRRSENKSSGKTTSLSILGAGTLCQRGAILRALRLIFRLVAAIRGC
jgi:hypothetical protein